MLLGEFDGFIYLSTMSPAGVLIYRSSSGKYGTWEQTNRPGMAKSDKRSEPENYVVVVDGAVVYNDALYLAVSNSIRGWEMWRTTGKLNETGHTLDWEPALPRLVGNRNQLYSVLAVFRGYLYAWVTNYHTGQQVMRTRCPVCQQAVISGSGEYLFDRVGVTLDFRYENLDRAEVCVFPQAAAEKTGPINSNQRLIEIYTVPIAASYEASISISAGDTESARLEKATWHLVKESFAWGQFNCLSKFEVNSANEGEFTCPSTSDLNGIWSIGAGYPAVSRAGFEKSPVEFVGWLGAYLILLLTAQAAWLRSIQRRNG